MYFLPIRPEVVLEIIQKEKPDGIMVNVGGQTALNVGQCALVLCCVVFCVVFCCCVGHFCLFLYCIVLCCVVFCCGRLAELSFSRSVRAHFCWGGG